MSLSWLILLLVVCIFVGAYYFLTSTYRDPNIRNDKKRESGTVETWYLTGKNKIISFFGANCITYTYNDLDWYASHDANTNTWQIVYMGNTHSHIYKYQSTEELIRFLNRSVSVVTVYWGTAPVINWRR